MTELTIILPMPSRALSPNGRVHWAVKAKAKKAYRELAGYLAFDAMNKRGMDQPRWKRATATIRAYFKGQRPPDPDNIIASLKSGFDGFVDAGVMADDVGFSPMPPTVQRDNANPRVEIVIACNPET